MAEILLSLTIIGVVAAITLPSLTGNINERTWNTQRKALYARFSQAIALMPALNGYGTLIEGNESTSAVDTAAETFVTDGLAKVLKINNICDSEHLADCGIPSKILNLNGSLAYSPFPKTLEDFNSNIVSMYYSPLGYSYNQLNTKGAAFETTNGESIAVFYNPFCTYNTSASQGTTRTAQGWYYTQAYMCANFIYDLNGPKGPNTVGKDIGFITALYSTDSSVVAPMPVMKDSNEKVAADDVAGFCSKQDPETRVPNLDELASMYYNLKLLNLTHPNYWSSEKTPIPEYKLWHHAMNLGYRAPYNLTVNIKVRCIKR